jgi:predicted outer membrane protein
MKRYLALGALMAFATPAGAQDLFAPFFGAGTETTQQFRAEAVRGDAYEIESSRMALERSRSPRVRAFARRMINDHSRTTAALLPPGTRLTAAGNVAPENEPGILDNGPLGILVAPLSIPVNIVGGALGGETLGQPQQPGRRVAIDPRRAAMLNTLSTTSDSRSFNAAYADQQVRAHQEQVALYTNEAQNGDMEEARTFAAQALPSLQDHLSHATTLDERVGGPAAPAF